MPKQHSLLKHSLIVMSLAQVSNLAAVAFHMLSGRMLGDGEYGTLVMMMNVTMLVMFPLEALRTMAANYAARYIEDGTPGMIKSLGRYWTVRLMCLSVPVLVLMVIFRNQLADAFHIAEPQILMVTGFSIVMYVTVPLFSGFLQGLQRFVGMSATLYSCNVTRFLVGGGLMLLMTPSALLGMSGHFTGTLLASLAGFFLLERALPGKATPSPDRHESVRYMLRSSIPLVSFALMVNADILLVKFYLPEMGDYAAKAGTISRSLVFLPIPIALAMFPKVVAQQDHGPGRRMTLIKAATYVIGLIVGSVGLCVVVPSLPLYILFGVRDAPPELLFLVQGYVLAMAPLSLFFVLLNYALARNYFILSDLALVPSLVFIGGVILLHQSLKGLLVMLSIGSYGSVLMLLLGFWIIRMRRESNAKVEPTC